VVRNVLVVFHLVEDSRLLPSTTLFWDHALDPACCTGTIVCATLGRFSAKGGLFGVRGRHVFWSRRVPGSEHHAVVLVRLATRPANLVSGVGLMSSTMKGCCLDLTPKNPPDRDLGASAHCVRNLEPVDGTFVRVFGWPVLLPC
jgi:hypothetical protein